MKSRHNNEPKSGSNEGSNDAKVAELRGKIEEIEQSIATCEGNKIKKSDATETHGMGNKERLALNRDLNTKIAELRTEMDRVIEEIKTLDPKFKAKARQKAAPSKKLHSEQGDEVAFPKRLEDLNAAQTSDEIVALLNSFDPEYEIHHQKVNNILDYIRTIKINLGNPKFESTITSTINLLPEEYRIREKIAKEFGVNLLTVPNEPKNLEDLNAVQTSDEILKLLESFDPEFKIGGRKIDDIVGAINRIKDNKSQRHFFDAGLMFLPAEYGIKDKIKREFIGTVPPTPFGNLKNLEDVKNASSISEIVSSLKLLDPKIELKPSAEEIIQLIDDAIEKNYKTEADGSLSEETRKERDAAIDKIPVVYGIQDKVKTELHGIEKSRKLDKFSELEKVSSIDEIVTLLESFDPKHPLEITTTGQVSQKVQDVLARIKWAKEANDKIQPIKTTTDSEKSSRDYWVSILPEIYGIRAKIRKELVEIEESRMVKPAPEKKDLLVDLGLSPEQLRELEVFVSFEEILDYLKDVQSKSTDRYTGLENSIIGIEDVARATSEKDKKDALKFIHNDVKASIQKVIDAHVIAPHTPITPPATPAVANFDSLKLEREQLQRGLSKFKATDEQHKLIKSRIDDINKTIAGSDDVYGKNKKAVDTDPTKDNEVWAQEKLEAEAQLNSARNAYMYKMKAEKAEEAKASWFTKLWRAPIKVLEEMSWKKAPESNEFIRLRGEYDTAKKRYGNAIGNQMWLDHRQLHGDTPIYVEEKQPLSKRIMPKLGSFFSNDKKDPKDDNEFVINNAYKLVQAEISKKLLDEVAIKEFKLLQAAEIEGMPPREKSMVFKALESYSKVSRSKKLLISASICTGIATATGMVAVPAAATMFITRLMYGAVGGVAGSAAGTSTKKVLGFFANRSKGKRSKDLEGNFSVISGVNDYDKLIQEFEKREFRHKILSIMTSGAVAMGSGITMRSALADAGLVGNSSVAKPSVNQTPSSSEAYVTPAPTPTAISTEVPIEKVSSTMPTNSAQLDTFANNVYQEDFDRVTARPDLQPFGSDVPNQFSQEDMYKTSLENNDGIPENHRPAQVNTPVPEPVAPKANVRTFEDNINDRENGIRLRKGDSAELSAKRIFQNNAKELGYDKDSGLTKNKWAEAQVEKLVKDHPEVRNTITHDGNKIKIEFNENGSVKDVYIIKESGLTPKASNVVEGRAKANVVESKTNTAPRAEPSGEKLIPKSASAVPEKVIPNSAPSNVMPSSPNVSSEVIAQAVGKELPGRVGEIFPAKSGFFGNASPLNDKRWIAMSNVKADALLKNPLTNVPEFVRVNNLPSDITVGQIKAIKEMVKMGGEYKVLKPRMTVSDAVKAVIANQEVGRITRAAGARK